MSCRLEILTDSRISLAERWILEKIYCAPYVNYYNFVENYIFRFNQSLTAVAIIIFIYTFLYLRLNKIIFKSMFINQLLDFLDENNLPETEVCLYFFSIPIIFVFIAGEQFEYAIKRPMNNLVYSCSILLISMPILLATVLLASDKSLKVLKNSTILSLGTILGFIIIIICGLIVGKLTYTLCIIVYLLVIGYSIGYVILGRRDKNFEIMTQNTYDKDKVQQVFFYPDEIAGEFNVQSKVKMGTSVDSPLKRTIGSRIDLKISGYDARTDQELEKVSTIFKENIEKQKLKFKMIEDLEEELKEVDPWWVKERRKYIDDTELSTYMLDNLITYIAVVFLVLTVPSQKNPLVLRGYKFIPLTIGAIACMYNVSKIFNIFIIVFSIVFLIIYYAIKACLSDKAKLWLDNMIFSIFIWCFMFNILRLFFDFTLFIQFFYDFTEGEADAIKGLVYLIPLSYLNYALYQRKRSVLAFNISLAVMIKLALVNFAYDGIKALRINAHTFDIKTKALYYRSATFIIPIQLLALCLLVIILLIFFSVTGFKTKKVIALCLLVIIVGYILSIYTISLMNLG